MSTDVAAETRLVLSDDQARALATKYGTPLYVIDEHHLRNRVRAYIKAFRAAHDKTELTYASKANSTLAVVAIVASEGCPIDVASEGELRAALRAGIPAKNTHLHGNAKSAQEIKAAFDLGVGQIIVDNFEEIDAVAGTKGNCPDLLLRLAPGVSPKTHAKISTGQDDTKFGFNIADGSAERALTRCLELGLPVVGFHCHVGSQLLDPEAQIGGGRALATFAAEMAKKQGFMARVLNLGGGVGIRYDDQSQAIDPRQYCLSVVQGVKEGLAGSGLDPVIVQEPGRWIIGESCVTLYSVNNVKTVPTKDGTRTYVSVDGGMADNPRPAMYGSPYPVRWISADESAPGAPMKVRIAGRHCESDTLFDDKTLPSNVKKGDVLQVLCTGAYNSSMASNYNRYPRPTTVLLRPDGSDVVVQRPETWDEMYARESVPEGLGR
ncbi:MAG TPA: diaminopimelate decarboxylase [Fimbriimonadaceae bacterium]|nr:diaminopimelate decarboxylase [Fimbriimonadaceae bacterium]